MPIITLPDGNNLDFPKKVTGLEVAEKISKSLAKQAMVISIDGELKDLDFKKEKSNNISMTKATTKTAIPTDSKPRVPTSSRGITDTNEMLGIGLL